MSLRWLACVTLLCLVPCSARAQSGWTDEGVRLHGRASRLHLAWVFARHDLARLPSQRACFDDIASRVGALTRMLEDRAALGRMPRWSLRDAEAQLDALEETAAEVCTITRERDGDVDRELWRDPFLQRMPRDRAILRLGLRGEVTPRVARGGYAPVTGYAIQGALGVFVTPFLRVEGVASFAWLPPWGPWGSVGARAMLTAPWSLLRVAGGLAANVMLASDMVGGNGFCWLGFQLEIPLELGFEISDSFGLTVTGGPVYTQAGAVRLDPRAIGGQLGILAEIVL